jgi:hypothetical protein
MHVVMPIRTIQAIWRNLASPNGLIRRTRIVLLSDITSIVFVTLKSCQQVSRFPEV